MSKKRKRSFQERLNILQEKGTFDENGVEDKSKLKHGDDYRGKLVKENERFQEKILEKESKRREFSKDEFEDSEIKKRRNRRYESFEGEKEIIAHSPSFVSKEEPKGNTASKPFIEGEVYDPLAKDTDNDGIIDRYDHNFKDSDYYESVYDEEDPKKDDVKVPSSKKERNRKVASHFRKQEKKKNLYQDTSKRRNYEDKDFTRAKTKDDKSTGRQVIRDRQKKNKSLEELKKTTKDSKIKAGLLTGASKSQELTRDYLSTGSDDNVGVEAGEKVAHANSKLLHESQRVLFNKRKKVEDSSKASARSLKSKKSKLEFRNEEETLKMEQKRKTGAYKKFQKRKQMKSAIYERKHVRLRDRIKKSLKSVAIKAKDFMVRKSKTALLIIGAVILLGTVFFNLGSGGLSLVTNTTNTTLTTTYLSSEQVLKSIDEYFVAKEDELREELEQVEVNHPGYAEYIINNAEYIGHNVHELLSYITSRFGEVKNVSEITAYLDELFDAMYDVHYEVEIEIRYRTVVETYVDENGNEYEESHEEPYEYKKLIVTLEKREMDSIIREIFTGYPDNLKHYEALFLTQGNMGEVFGNGDLIALNGGIGGGQEYEASGEVQKRIVNAAYVTPSPGPGWCAMWVSQVYQNAGLGYLGGNANDMYRNFTYTSDPSKLEVGMIVAVESSSSGGELGLIYGHVGIYIGDGMVMDNIGVVRVTTLEDWINTFCKHSPVGYGFPPSVQGQ